MNSNSVRHGLLVLSIRPFGGEGRNADRVVLVLFVEGIAVAHTHARWCPDCFACPNSDLLISDFDLHSASDNDGELAEVRGLMGLTPPWRSFHAGEAQLVGSGMDAADHFIDLFTARDVDPRPGFDMDVVLF